MRLSHLLQRAGDFYRRRPALALFCLFVATSLASRGFLLGVDILDVDEAMHIVGSWELLRGRHLSTWFRSSSPFPSPHWVFPHSLATTAGVRSPAWRSWSSVRPIWRTTCTP